MFGIGVEELIVVFVIALFVLGPERLPSLARDVGKAVRELRRASDELTEEFLRADQARPEPPAPPSLPAPDPAPEQSTETPGAHADATTPRDDVTEFDKKAQDDADRARERGELVARTDAAAPPSEPERWG